MMRLSFVTFFLFIIAASVVLSIRQQIYDMELYKMIENEDCEDSQEDINKKSPFEKDLYIYNAPQTICNKGGIAYTTMTKSRGDEDLAGPLYRTLPYIPPK